MNLMSLERVGELERNNKQEMNWVSRLEVETFVLSVENILKRFQIKKIKTSMDAQI